MSNSIINIIKMNGIANEDIYRTDAETGARELDFDKLLPQPKKENEVPFGYHSFEGIELELIPEKPWLNWYDWNSDFWGTSHNAFDTEFIGEDEVQFTTMHGAPFKVMQALSAKFPDRVVEVKTTFCEECMSFSATLRAGQVVWQQRDEFNPYEQEQERSDYE